MLTLVAGLTLFGPSIQAQDDTDPDADAAITVGRVDVLQVSGFMDPILVDAIDEAIDRAVDDGSQALILQVNSDGTVVGDDVVEDLLVRVATAPVPIGIWVGPSGARFYGTAAQLLAVAVLPAVAGITGAGYNDPTLLAQGFRRAAVVTAVLAVVAAAVSAALAPPGSKKIPNGTSPDARSRGGQGSSMSCARQPRMEHLMVSLSISKPIARRAAASEKHGRPVL